MPSPHLCSTYSVDRQAITQEQSLECRITAIEIVTCFKLESEKLGFDFVRYGRLSWFFPVWKDCDSRLLIRILPCLQQLL